ncbi:PD-(D/E)XK nuclease family transposase [Lactobacillus sp. 3B(2020)]|nr:hypothetical protein GTO83_00715 [Lactobacillus sp. 3B(2020)]
MANLDICLKLIRRSLLKIELEHIKSITRQHHIKGPVSIRGARFDVYLWDDQNRIFTVEMQVQDHNNTIHRACFYQE